MNAIAGTKDELRVDRQLKRRVEGWSADLSCVKQRLDPVVSVASKGISKRVTRMNPLFMGIIATVLHLVRTCPKCRHRQIVSTKKKRDTVRCKRCGSDIPPRKS